MANQADPPEVMTQDTWLERVRENKDALRTLIVQYHPAVAEPKQASGELPITAPNAELACQNVRASIRAEHEGKTTPVSMFDAAVNHGDVGVLMGLFESVWFGVPESTGCWGIPGFKLLVDLLDDPPEAAQGASEPAVPEDEQFNSPGNVD